MAAGRSSSPGAAAAAGEQATQHVCPVMIAQVRCARKHAQYPIDTLQGLSTKHSAARLKTAQLYDKAVCPQTHYHLGTTTRQLLLVTAGVFASRLFGRCQEAGKQQQPVRLAHLFAGDQFLARGFADLMAVLVEIV